MLNLCKNNAQVKLNLEPKVSEEKRPKDVQLYLRWLQEHFHQQSDCVEVQGLLLSKLEDMVVLWLCVKETSFFLALKVNVCGHRILDLFLLETKSDGRTKEAMSWRLSSLQCRGYQSFMLKFRFRILNRESFEDT